MAKLIQLPATCPVNEGETLFLQWYGASDD